VEEGLVTPHGCFEIIRLFLKLHIASTSQSGQTLTRQKHNFQHKKASVWFNIYAITNLDLKARSSWSWLATTSHENTDNKQYMKKTRNNLKKKSGGGG
jgi:hypothetical protein